MEIIRNLVQNLALIVILALFLEMFLPSGEMQRYVRMVIGLLVAVVIIQAAGEIAHKDFTGDIPVLTASVDSQKVAGIMDEGKKMAGLNEEKAFQDYRRALSSQVLALAQMDRDVPVIGAEVMLQKDEGRESGQVEEIILEVSGKQDPGRISDKGGMPLVEPVAVISKDSSRLAAENGGLERVDAGKGEVPSTESVVSLKKTLAGFYNIDPGRVRVVYRN
ncbi:MAG: stage III sporulation protein AF [Eubacteriales bacterium]